MSEKRGKEHGGSDSLSISTRLAETEASLRPTGPEGSLAPDEILKMHRLQKRYGGLAALDVDRLIVRRGTVTSLIGPNGAGKSTLFNVVTAFEKADHGDWEFDGQDVSGLSAYRIARLGLVRTFQMTRPLADMSVLDNLKLGVPMQRGESMSGAFMPWRWRAEQKRVERKAHGLLQEFGLSEKAGDLAGSLSGGQQRLLEIARALMAEPRLLMLDEPLGGVNPVLRKFLMERLKSLSMSGTTVVLVEHDIDSIMQVSDDVICMSEGKVIAQGDPETVSRDERVVDAYLGRSIAEPQRQSRHVVNGTGASRPTRNDQGTRSRAESALDVHELVAGYRPNMDIVRGCDLIVGKGESVCIIGPNGAGKSTLLKAIFGLVQVRRGSIYFHGEGISGKPTHDLVARGIGYVPQQFNVFGRLSVAENLRMGIFLKPKQWEERYSFVADVFPLLRERSNQLAGSLSGGERQTLGMARALMGGPSLLLLDEPSAGLSPIRQDELFEQIATVIDTGVALLMVEQNARQALHLCDRGYVLNAGQNAHSGTGSDLLNDPKVRRLYLGTLA